MNKLLTFYTDSHEGMFNEFFLKSYNDHLSGDYELINYALAETSPPKGLMRLCLKK